MATARSIITAALKKSGVIGVGQTAQAEDANDAFDDLNDMIAQWQVKRWLVYHLVDSAFTSTGATSYTVGTGGNFNVARPNRIEAAFVRFLGSVSPQPDSTLKVLEAREDYNRIRLKPQQGFPQYIFYDAAFPTGAVFPWPVPTAGIYEIHLTLKEQLGAFANLNATVNLPPEYTAALKWNLTARICMSYALPVPSGIVALARDSLNTIRNANAQVPELKMPADVVPRRGGRYNVYTDQTNLN